MAAERLQASFSMGEIAPELHSRVDLELFKSALKRCKNFIVGRLGSLANRTGMRRVFGEFPKGTTRIIPFRFSNDEQYLLVFATATSIPYDGVAPSSSVNNWPCYVIRGGVKVATFYHPYSSEDLPSLRYTQVRDIMTITHKKHRPREVLRRAEDDWLMLSYDTDRKVFPPTVTAGSQEAASVAATDREWRWVVTSVNKDGQESLPSAEFASLTAGPAVTIGETSRTQFLTLTAPTIGNPPVEYNVYRGRNGYYGYVGSTDTAAGDDFEDTGVAPSYGDGPPKAQDPFVETAALIETDVIAHFDATNNMTKAVGTVAPFDNTHTLTYRVRVPQSGTVTILAEYRVGAGAWIPIGSNVHGETGITWAQELDVESGIITYTYAPRWASFEIKCNTPLTAGDSFRLTISSGTADLEGLDVTWTQVPGTTEDEYSYPAAVCLFEQRIVFGGFEDNPARIVTSRTGDFHNFDTSDFVQDDESVELYLASGKMDEIFDLIPFRTVIALTNSAEWSISGSGGDPLSPSSFDVKPHTYNGSSRTVPGLALDGEVFFVSPTGKTIRSVTYSQERDALQATQINIQSSHLFTSKVKSWAYADNDEAAVVWVVLEDGTLLSLTYMPAFNVAAWAKHETNGLVEDVACVIEAGEWSTYLLVARPRHYTLAGASAPSAFPGYTIANPRPVVQLERLEAREDADIRKGNYLDSSSVYTGINTTAALTMLPSLNDATNGGFETGDMTGWTTIEAGVGSPAAIYTPADAHTGDYACYMHTIYSTFGPVDKDTDIEQSFTTVIGEDIVASVWYRPTKTRADTFIELAIDDGSGSYDHVHSIETSTLTIGEWVQLTRSVAATDTDGRVRVRLHNTIGPLVGGSATGLIDDFVVAQAGITLTASSAFFSASMVGDRMYLRDPIPDVFPFTSDPLLSTTSQDDPYIFEITAFSSNTEVTVDAIDVPAAAYGVPTSVWSRARRAFSIDTTPGDSTLVHLQHQDVSFLGDGVPGTVTIGYALDNPVTTETVTFDLGRHCEYVVIGYPYVSEIETLPIPEARNKKKLLSRLNVDVAYSRGFKAGPSELNLVEKIVSDPTDPYIMPLRTELLELSVSQSWEKRGSIIIRNDQPLPFKIIAVGMEVTASALP
jgi:hypothetical protein